MVCPRTLRRTNNFSFVFYLIRFNLYFKVFFLFCPSLSVALPFVYCDLIHSEHSLELRQPLLQRSRNFWPKFEIFQRSLKKSQTIVLPFTCLLMIEIRLRKLFTVFRWCKTCAHWIIEHEKILLKKKFSSKFLA